MPPFSLLAIVNCTLDIVTGHWKSAISTKTADWHNIVVMSLSPVKLFLNTGENYCPFILYPWIFVLNCQHICSISCEIVMKKINYNTPSKTLIHRQR